MLSLLLKYTIMSHSHECRPSKDAPPGPGSEHARVSEGSGSPKNSSHKAEESGRTAGAHRGKALAVGSIQAPKSATPLKKGIASFRSKDKEAAVARTGSSDDSFSR